MKNQTCCFTGHRHLPREEYAVIARRLEEVVVGCIAQGYRYFGAGGALGFDTLAAQTVLKLKNLYPDIRLILVLPCLSQTRGWAKEDILTYEQIKAQADKVVYTAQTYYRGCMPVRNRHLVDHSSLCIAYCTNSTGGTAYTVDYAQKKELPVVNVAGEIG